MEQNTWTANKQHVYKMSVAKMRMLKWMSDKTSNDRIRNESVYGSLAVTPIGDKMREN